MKIKIDLKCGTIQNNSQMINHESSCFSVCKGEMGIRIRSDPGNLFGSGWFQSGPGYTFYGGSNLELAFLIIGRIRANLNPDSQVVVRSWSSFIEGRMQIQHFLLNGRIRSRLMVARIRCACVKECLEFKPIKLRPREEPTKLILTKISFV